MMVSKQMAELSESWKGKLKSASGASGVEGVNTTRSSVAATVGPDAKGHAAVVRATHLPLRCAGRVL